MIYKISAINVPAAFQKGGNIIAVNTNGVDFLMNNLTDISGIEIAAEYNDSELNNLLTSPEWQSNSP